MLKLSERAKPEAATDVIAEGRPARPWLVEVGDFVCVGVAPPRPPGAPMIAAPALVTRVDEPGNPRSTIAVHVFAALDAFTMVAVKHSPDLAAGMWTWRGPRADGRPR